MALQSVFEIGRQVHGVDSIRREQQYAAVILQFSQKHCVDINKIHLLLERELRT